MSSSASSLLERPGPLVGGRPLKARGGERIQLRDGDLRVGGINHAGQRVDDRHGEDPLAIGHAGDGVEIEIALQLAEAFVIREEEQLVLDERPADGGSELVALQRGLHEDGGAEQEAGGVQIGVAQVLVGRAVEAVGSGFHDGADHRAAHAPVFGAVVAGDHFEFGERVRRQLHQLGGIALVAGAVGIVIQAVQQKIVIRAAHAVYVEGAFPRRAGGREGGRHRRLDGVGG